MAENIDWNEQLATAASKYDFELIKEAVKNGAENDDIIFLRIINRDKVELLDYILFSPELKKNYDLNFKHHLYGDSAAFKFACNCGSLKVVEYLINDARVSPLFDFEDLAQIGLDLAAQHGSYEVVQYLLNCDKTKNFCNLATDGLSAFHLADNRKRHEFVTKMVLNHPNKDDLVEMGKCMVNCKDTYDKAMAARNLKDELENDLNRNKSDKKSMKI